QSFNRYPECQPKKLISYYADYVHVSTQEVLATRGADEGIDLLIKAFCEPEKDAIICCPPTYDMYHISANISNVSVKLFSLIKNSWQIDIF
ncbi:MAG: aminotransferase class I/II-fold pyridoxal phosphate-dependent enzyme, partial [Buchnera aphidicola]|nr:aminotransferase class I/II-fold pyridoxal phosphate-dependent enzyme [Buchnera aphidicola]